MATCDNQPHLESRAGFLCWNENLTKHYSSERQLQLKPFCPFTHEYEAIVSVYDGCIVGSGRLHPSNRGAVLLLRFSSLLICLFIVRIKTDHFLHLLLCSKPCLFFCIFLFLFFLLVIFFFSFYLVHAHRQQIYRPWSLYLPSQLVMVTIGK